MSASESPRRVGTPATWDQPLPETFLGIPKATLDSIDAASALIGAECATPYPLAGAYCEGAPDAIREAMHGYPVDPTHIDFDFDEPLFAYGVDAVDLGNLPYDVDDAAKNRDIIKNATKQILNQGAFPIVVGGDDSIPIPVISAYEDLDDVVVVQIDAHIDFRDDVNGERFGLSSTMRRVSEMPHVSDIIQIGQRNVGSGRIPELEASRARGVKLFSARRVYSEGIQAAIDLIPSGKKVIVTLDCDALDPSANPGVLTRAAGGLNYWHIVEVLRGVAKRGTLIGFTLVEFMPERDVDGIGALTNARIICNAMGVFSRQANGYTNW